MKYSKKVICHFKEEFDFSSVETTLLPNDFRVIERSKLAMKFAGRGMNSTKENPVRGATEIALKAENKALHLNAKLGGVVKLSLFICLFPPLLILLMTFFSSEESEVINYLWVWFVIGPVMTFWLYRRTIHSLDTLLDNAVTMQPLDKLS